jgi:hypothetical protein
MILPLFVWGDYRSPLGICLSWGLVWCWCSVKSPGEHQGWAPLNTVGHSWQCHQDWNVRAAFLLRWSAIMFHSNFSMIQFQFRVMRLFKVLLWKHFPKMHHIWKYISISWKSWRRAFLDLKRSPKRMYRSPYSLESPPPIHAQWNEPMPSQANSLPVKQTHAGTHWFWVLS